MTGFVGIVLVYVALSSTDIPDSVPRLAVLLAGVALLVVEAVTDLLKKGKS